MDLLPNELQNKIYSYVGKHKIAELLEYNIDHYNTEIIYNFNSFTQLQDRYDIDDIYDLDYFKTVIIGDKSFTYCRDELSFIVFLNHYKLLNGTIDALYNSHYTPKFFDWELMEYQHTFRKGILKGGQECLS